MSRRKEIMKVIESRKNIHGHLRPNERLEVSEERRGYLTILASCVIYEGNGEVRFINKTHALNIGLAFNVINLDIWVDEIIDNILDDLRLYAELENSISRQVNDAE